jgi:hypothetical protein
MTKWYERGSVGEEIRDVLDYYDDDTAVDTMLRLGLNYDEIAEVLAMEETLGD